MHWPVNEVMKNLRGCRIWNISSRLSALIWLTLLPSSLQNGKNKQFYVPCLAILLVIQWVTSRKQSTCHFPEVFLMLKRNSQEEEPVQAGSSFGSTVPKLLHTIRPAASGSPHLLPTLVIKLTDRQNTLHPWATPTTALPEKCLTSHSSFL